MFDTELLGRFRFGASKLLDHTILCSSHLDCMLSIYGRISNTSMFGRCQRKLFLMALIIYVVWTKSSKVSFRCRTWYHALKRRRRKRTVTCKRTQSDRKDEVSRNLPSIKRLYWWACRRRLSWAALYMPPRAKIMPLLHPQTHRVFVWRFCGLFGGWSYRLLFGISCWWCVFFSLSLSHIFVSILRLIMVFRWGWCFFLKAKDLTPLLPCGHLYPVFDEIVKESVCWCVCVSERVISFSFMVFCCSKHVFWLLLVRQHESNYNKNMSF